MLTNQGTLIVLSALIASAVLLVVFLIVLVNKGKKGPKGLGVLKFFTFLLALSASALSVVTPLVYTNTIDINLTYGMFTPTDDSPYSFRLRVHRTGLDIEKADNGERLGEAEYTLEGGNLSYDYGGKTYKFEVRGFGKHLYENGVMVLHYQNGGRN
ncbi:MAG: hypothetical protein IK034_03955 [Bacilli bacterium]|nr:hypothetical protein [Bacilli bacterium]